MGVPLLILIFPPLLVLYPTSWVVGLFKSGLARRRKGTRLLSSGTLQDLLNLHASKSSESGKVIERVGEDTLLYCEDAVVWPRARVAIFSSDPGRPVYDAFNGVGDAAAAQPGRLVVYDLDTRASHVLDIQGWPATRAFHPLGLGLREEGNGPAVLAVVNLPNPSIDMFQLSLDTSSRKLSGKVSATFLHHLEHPSLTTPNAVLPLSRESVIVSNSFGFSARRHRTLNSLEAALAVPLGSVMHLLRGEYITRAEHAHVDTLSRGISIANGLALSPDGRVLVIAGSGSQSVHVYDIDPPAGATFDTEHAQFRETIHVGFPLDNLRTHASAAAEVGGTYEFLGAGCPVPLDFFATASSRGEKRAPSRVVRISVSRSRPSMLGLRAASAWLSARLRRVDPRRVQTMFEDDGELVSGASTAVGFVGARGGEMLVMGLWDRPGALHCVDVDL